MRQIGVTRRVSLSDRDAPYWLVKLIGQANLAVLALALVMLALIKLG